MGLGDRHFLLEISGRCFGYLAFALLLAHFIFYVVGMDLVSHDSAPDFFGKRFSLTLVRGNSHEN